MYDINIGLAIEIIDDVKDLNSIDLNHDLKTISPL